MFNNVRHSLHEGIRHTTNPATGPGESPFEDVTTFTSQDPQDSPRSLQSQDSQNCSINSERPGGTPDNRPKLAPSRSYTLSLSPYFLYTRSQLISTLISSKVYRQLEFLAVGSWWIYSDQSDVESSAPETTGVLYRVPGNREDVFADSHISMKSKRTLMRFLRHISKPQDEEGEAESEKEDLSTPFEDYLNSKFQVPQELHNPLLSLSLSHFSLPETSAAFAVPRVKRHLASIGALGPGFGAVISKWGGGSEILQVACRASAVGGGVYALDTAIQSLAEDEAAEGGDDQSRVKVQLSNGDLIRTKFVVGSLWDLPSQNDQPVPCGVKVARSITIVSSTFASLFPVTVEGAPTPASAVLMFPGATLRGPGTPPVYLQVHSSDTGECPRQQSKSSFLLVFPPCSYDDYSQYLSTLPVLSLMRSQSISLITSNLSERLFVGFIIRSCG